jgi:mono/diheme cytochrome c family protein
MRMAVMAMAAVFLAWPAAAQSPPLEAGDPVAGQRVAQMWCANCHVVAADGARGTDGAPTFRTIAERGSTADGLRAFLATQHGRMPNLSLTNTDIENVVAHLLSLKGK